ncbi:MAG TPA: hypothetical protein VFQ75_05235, partial [Candidatus Limnocylindrales bacterium]|nr:hypothetical protein [Candidatus Limnocylindrales bacterium]
TNAASYQVQFSSSATFPGTLTASNTETTTAEGIRVPVTAVGVKQYWRVRARTAGERQVGPWSSTRSFTVTWKGAPTLISPADGATVSTQVFAWTPVAGAIRYDLQFAAPDDAAFSGSVATTDSELPSKETGFAPPTTKLWRVAAVNEAGVRGPWSAARLITIDDGPPAPAAPDLELPQVQLTGPADGALVADPFATPLSFAPVAGATMYQAQLAKADAEFITDDPVVFDNRVNLGPIPWTPDWGETWQWRVRARAPGNIVGPWSEVRTFSTAPIGSVDTTAPGDGTAQPGDELILRWQAASGQSSAWVELSRTSDFADPVGPRVYGEPLLAVNGTLEPGTWYWRVAVGRGAIVARSPVRTFEATDVTPPAGVPTIDGGWYSIYDPVSVHPDASDTGSGVAAVGISADGVTWAEHDYPWQPATWSLTQPPYGSTPGERPVWLRWRDVAGNWSTPIVQRITYATEPPTDTAAPAMTLAPRMTLLPHVPLAGGKAAVTVRWQAADVGIGVARYDLERDVDGRGYSFVTDDAPSGTWTTRHAAGHTIRYRGRAVDGAFNASAFAASPRYVLRGYSERNAAVTYRGTWRTVTSSAYWGGGARASTDAGAKASLMTTSSQVAWIARRGPDRGRAAVYVNGTKVATIDLWAPTYRGQVVAWLGTWPTAASRRVTVVVSGTHGRPRVDVDGFITLR